MGHVFETTAFTARC